jgi:transposase InsO family protein
VDFITGLPESQGCTNLMVITDRLGKGILLETMRTTEAKDVTRVFLRTFYCQHGLPAAIVSDQGSQFVSTLWKRICQLLGIVRRLSTAYHQRFQPAQHATVAQQLLALLRVAQQLRNSCVRYTQLGNP